MANSTENRYYNQLMYSRIQQARAKTGQQPTAINSTTEDKTRNVVASGVQKGLVATGVGIPLAALAGKLIQNKFIFRLLLGGAIVTAFITLVLLLAPFISIYYTLDYYGLL